MTKKRFLLFGILIILLHITLIIFYGMRKEGFHEDEYYTYWSSSGYPDLGVGEDYRWRSGLDIQKQFMVRRDNRFAFDEVINNQIRDVHPPLYYLSLNVFMSVFAGRFYKWFGILLNLAFSVITLLGIFCLFEIIDTGKHRYYLALAAGAVYAFAPSTVSNVMLTRMYAMSAMWTVLYACVLMGLHRSYGCSRKKFAVLTLSGCLICYLSFLTHYFCLLEAFLLTLLYAVYILAVKRRGIVRLLVFGSSMIAAIALAVCTFPESLQHIFAGYRGTDTIDDLLHADFMDRLKIFLPILDKNIFAGMLLPAGLITILAFFFLIITSFQNNTSEEKSVSASSSTILFTATVMSLFLMTKTALILGDASSRYFYPITALLLPLMAYFVIKAVYLVTERFSVRLRWSLLCMVSFLIAVPILVGHIGGNVLFLYEDDKEKKEFAIENQNYPAVMVYNDGAAYRLWYITDQMWPYQHILFANYEYLSQDFEDEILMQADKVIVYMSCDEETIETFLKKHTKLSTLKRVEWGTLFFAVFVFE